MDYNKFRDISCCEEFEIQCDLRGISKIDILKEIGHKIDDYYFFVSNNGVFNWFDLDGNHVEDPGVLKELYEKYIPKTITKCSIPNGVKNIGEYSFYECNSLKEITIPNSVRSIKYGAFYKCNSLKKFIFKGRTLEEVKRMEYYPFGIKDESIIKVPEMI